MKFLNLIFLSITVLFIHSCIQDDFVDDKVDPVLRITSLIDSLEINTEFQFESLYLNNIGNEENASVEWSSSDNTIISIREDGLATALADGTATIKVSFDDAGNILEAEQVVHVGDTTIIVDQSIMGSIMTTSSYTLEGDFILTENSTGIEIEFLENYAASTALPGLYIYLSNNRNSVANGFEIGAVDVFNGAHSYEIPGFSSTDFQYLVYFCKPFNVKVGDGEF